MSDRDRGKDHGTEKIGVVDSPYATIPSLWILCTRILSISNQNIQIIESGPLNVTQHKVEPREKERANQVTCNATLLYITYKYR